MFTGIITHIGNVQEKTATGLTIQVSVDFFMDTNERGSVAVNGVCLTVTGRVKSQRSFSVDIMPETWKRTALGLLATDDPVNLELPLAASGRFEGHIVQGHVDAVATIQSIQPEGNSRMVRFRVPRHLTRYMVEKGSIAVNGISLTIIGVGVDWFTVGIIPYTWTHTILHRTNAGDTVNVEVDVIAKYIERLYERT